jgi:hypothetical protein
MGWLKLDDVFGTHPKIAGLSDRAFRAHVVAMLYAAQHLTDGFIPTAVAPRKAIRDELVGANLWSPIEGGWLIHDFLEYNPARAEVLAEREASRARRSGDSRTNGDRPPGKRRANVSGPDPAPTPPQTQERKARERNPLHDTLAEIEGSNPHELTASRARTIGVALAEIKRATPDVTPQELHRRAEIYPQVLPPGTTLTAPALATHWARCGKAPAVPSNRRNEPMLDRMAREGMEAINAKRRGQGSGRGPAGELPG